MSIQKINSLKIKADHQMALYKATRGDRKDFHRSACDFYTLAMQDFLRDNAQSAAEREATGDEIAAQAQYIQQGNRQ